MRRKKFNNYRQRGGQEEKQTGTDSPAVQADTSRHGAEAPRSTMTRVSGAAAAIKSWPCPKDSLLQEVPFPQEGGCSAFPRGISLPCPHPSPRHGRQKPSLRLPPADESQPSSTPWGWCTPCQQDAHTTACPKQQPPAAGGPSILSSTG